MSRRAETPNSELLTPRNSSRGLRQKIECLAILGTSAAILFLVYKSDRNQPKPETKIDELDGLARLRREVESHYNSLRHPQKNLSRRCY